MTKNHVNFIPNLGLSHLRIFDPPPPSKSVRNSNTILLLVQIYCNFLKEVRLGVWGTEGPTAPTLGRHVSACATILRFRALLYSRKKYLISNLIINFHFLTEWWRTHSTYWPNVGAFRNLTYPPIWKLQYIIARSNVTHAT